MQDLENIKKAENDAFFKKTVNEYSQKVKELEQQLNQIQNEKSFVRFENKLGIMEQEMIDIKNLQKKRVETLKRKNLLMTADASERLDILVDDVDQLWAFLQKFIDQTGVNVINSVKAEETGIKEKIDALDWLARNSEFLSPDTITKCLMAFKELYTSENVQLKQKYINAKHNSQAVLTVLHLIEHSKMLEKDEETFSKLAILLSILEPLLINDQNLERALNSNGLEILFSTFHLPESFKYNDNVDDDTVKMKLPIYLKYCLRCLTSCLRSPVGVTYMLAIKTSISQILDFLDSVKDEEILANCSKIIRLILRDDYV